ncbi:predicted protein [Naegleria gruberi]|uniref:Predicted protein n=1 Tax=Naegleria gruberi TaxID=5762 RepID=D2UZX6_NAEGR|nr:uncharacterized protein NAEGRDRAFT_45576 [Naegleria gruberi]EFC50238.1 predicted protein [Naegleria gruberi]|eukprot:XP_002682982.1 predicted protein [Naegleria gruberi strain NEG-M]
MKSLQSTRKSLSIRALLEDENEEEEEVVANTIPNQNDSLTSTVSSNFVLRRQASKIKAASTSHIDTRVLLQHKSTPEEVTSDSSWIQDVSKNRDKYFEKIISEFDTLHDRLRETADSYKGDVRLISSSSQTVADWDSILTQDTKDYIGILKKEMEDLVAAHQEQDRENKRKFEEQIEQIRKFHDEQFRFIHNKSEELKAREYAATEIKVRNELDKQEYKMRQEMHAYKKKLETFMENYIQKEFKPHMELMFGNATSLMDLCKKLSLTTTNTLLKEECDKAFKRIDRLSVFDLPSKLKVIKAAILSSSKLDAVTADAEVQADETYIFIDQSVLQKKLHAQYQDKSVMVGAYTYEGFSQTDLSSQDIDALLEYKENHLSVRESVEDDTKLHLSTDTSVSPFASINSSIDSVAKHQLHKIVSSDKKIRKNKAVSRESSPIPLVKQASKTNAMRDSGDKQPITKQQRETPNKVEHKGLRKSKQEEKPQTPQPLQNSIQTPIHSPVHSPSHQLMSSPIQTPMQSPNRTPQVHNSHIQTPIKLSSSSSISISSQSPIQPPLSFAGMEGKAPPTSKQRIDDQIEEFAPLKSDTEPNVSNEPNVSIEIETRESQTLPLDETLEFIEDKSSPLPPIEIARDVVKERPIDNPVDMLEQVFSPRNVNESKKTKSKTPEFTRIKKQQEKKRETPPTKNKNTEDSTPKPLQKKNSQTHKKSAEKETPPKPLPRLSFERVRSDPTVQGNIRQSFPIVASQTSVQSSQFTQTTERLMSVSPRIPIKLPKLDLPEREEDSEVIYSTRSSDSSVASSDFLVSVSLSTIVPNERLPSAVKKRKKVTVDPPRKSLPKICEADRELIKRMSKVGTSIDDQMIPILEDLFVRAEIDPVYHYSKFTMKQKDCLIITHKLFPETLGGLNTILEETPKTPHLSVKTSKGGSFEEEFDKLLNYISYLKISYKRKEFMLTNQLKSLEVKVEELLSHNVDIRMVGESLRFDQSQSIQKLSNENVMLIQKIEQLNKQIQDIITGRWKYDVHKKELVYVKFEDEPPGSAEEFTSMSRANVSRQSQNQLSPNNDRTH